MTTTEPHRMTEVLSQLQLLLHGKPTTDLRACLQQDLFLPHFSNVPVTMKYQSLGGQTQKLLAKNKAQKGQNHNEIP